MDIKYVKEGFVYLIANSDVDGVYKIGVTTGDIYKRIKELQTGNSGELYLINYHKSNHPFFVEHTIHDRLAPNNKLNEWFELSDEQVFSFKKLCDEVEGMINALKDNPFMSKHLVD